MLMVVWTPPPAQCCGGVWGLLCVHLSHVPHHRPVVPWSSGPHLAAAVSVTQRARGETLAPAQPPETRADRQLAGLRGVRATAATLPGQTQAPRGAKQTGCKPRLGLHKPGQRNIKQIEDKRTCLITAVYIGLSRTLCYIQTIRVSSSQLEMVKADRQLEMELWRCLCCVQDGHFVTARPWRPGCGVQGWGPLTLGGR